MSLARFLIDTFGRARILQKEQWATWANFLSTAGQRHRGPTSADSESVQP